MPPRRAPRPYAGDEHSRLERLGSSYTEEFHGSDRSGTVHYTYNPHGHRSEAFDPEAKTLVAVFGESHAFGAGVAREDSWPDRFVTDWCARRGIDRDDVCLLNFAEGAAPNGYIAREALVQCARLAPDLVLVQFADFRRAEGHLNGRPIRIGGWFRERMALDQVEASEPGTSLRLLLEEWHARGREYFAARSDASDAADTLRNIVLVQSFLEARGIDAIATCDLRPLLLETIREHRGDLESLWQLVDPAFLSPDSIDSPSEVLDRAADQMHPGPASHARFAERISTFHAKQASRPETSRGAPEAHSASTPHTLRLFGADAAVPSGPGHWTEQLTAGLRARTPRLEARSPSVRERPNSAIATELLLANTRPSEDWIVVALGDDRLFEAWDENGPFTVLPPACNASQAAAGHGRGGSRRDRATLRRRAQQADHHHHYATDALAVMETLRHLLLAQEFLRARGLRGVVCAESASRLLSAECRANQSLGELIELLDPAFFDAAPPPGESPALSLDVHTAFAERLVQRLRGTARAPSPLSTPAGPILRSIRAFYDERTASDERSLEERVAWIRGPGVDAIPPTLQRALQDHHPRTILEFGCGTGELACALALQHDVEITALDASPRSIEQSRRLAEALGLPNRIRFAVADLLAPRLEDLPISEPHDVVLAVDTLHHTSNPAAACARLCTAVATGGSLFFDVQHPLPRIPFLRHFRSLLIEKGEAAALRQFRKLRDVRSLTPEQAEQLFHRTFLVPHESQHRYEEVLGWLHASGARLVATSLTGPNGSIPEGPLDAPQMEIELAARAVHAWQTERVLPTTRVGILARRD